MKPKHWIAIVGEFTSEGDRLTFVGGHQSHPDTPGRGLGNFLSDITFGSGKISCTITFTGDPRESAAGIILYHHPASGGFVEAQIGGPHSFCSLFGFFDQQWVPYGQAGVPGQIQIGKPYRLEVIADGSRVEVCVNDVRLIDVTLPYNLPRGHSGLWVLSSTDVLFDGFAVFPQKPEMFVVMQFSSPYEDLYKDVIEPIGVRAGYDVVRADNMYGPGIIITDIERHIETADVIVADITPVNANVYWEVGYARALRKPTILLAERGTPLPFDVSAFRVLLYEDSIGGKGRLEEGLAKHLEAVARAWPATQRNR